MFLDKFDLKLTAVDGEPCKPEDTYDLVLWSSGKIDRSKNGVPEEVKKEEVMRFMASLGVFYGVTPEEYAATMEKEKKDREAIRARLGQ